MGAADDLLEFKRNVESLIREADRKRAMDDADFNMATRA
jgi:hypothetical protein